MIKAIVVDDSTIFRMLVAATLADFGQVRVVGRCKNGQEAIDAIRREEPDLVTLDVEMPLMDGLEVLRQINVLKNKEAAFAKVQVIMISGITKQGTDITIQAMEEGAIDCVPKPSNADVRQNREELKQYLLHAVEAIEQREKSRPQAFPGKSNLQNSFQKNELASEKLLRQRLPKKTIDAKCLLIGISTGGPMALNSMLPELCQLTHLPICIVQHMPPGFTSSLADNLNKKCRHHVCEVADGEILGPDTVWIAPGGKHLTLIGTDERIQAKLTLDPPENSCRPSVDVLFRSAASILNGNTIAMVLTGMGSDGSKGIQPIVESGGVVIAQDEESSSVWGMPGSAVASGFVHEMVTLMSVPRTVMKYLR